MTEPIYSITEGHAGETRVTLTAPDGAEAEIYVNGATVTSWLPAHGVEQMFLSPRAQFARGAAIRGGIPVIFPQFSGEGPLPKHGFARQQVWAFGGAEEVDGDALARFHLTDNEETRAVWPHAFRAELAVLVGGNRLKVTLTVTNLDAEPFEFTAALHTYLRVDDVRAAAVEGLGGRAYLDAVGGRNERVQEQERLVFDGEVDRIYFDAPQPLTLVEGSRKLSIRMDGFRDAVVWNPGSELSERLGDMQPEGYREMVCVEAVALGEPVRLQPGQAWSGFQQIEALAGGEAPEPGDGAEEIGM